MEEVGGFIHTVRQGDTLYSLSREYGVAVEALIEINPYINIYSLRAGDEVCVPRRIKPRRARTGS